MLRKLMRLDLLLLAAAVVAGGCKSTSAPTADSNGPAPRPNSIELVFTYSSEKEAWIKDITDRFNRGDHQISGGRPIFVKAIPMGSGDAIDELLSGSRQAHVTSPASAAFIKLGNAKSRASSGKDLLGPTETLMLSPVVIAMWKPMAEAIGWGKKPIGWSEILSLARNPQGWAAYGKPQWGKFKFGHTHPEFSNSGLISLFAEVYAATNKLGGLTIDDVNRPATAAYLDGIEQAVVHYGTSTGFFGSKMMANGPEYLSAAVLYESNVIESYLSAASLPFPIVAIYPKEGTFWSDHPVAIVDRDWVTPQHREAANALIKFMFDRPQQEKTLEYGFHPGDVSVQLGAPIDQAHGVNPTEPKTTLEVPSVDVMDAVIRLFREHKKHANVVLVFDTSGSMQDNGKMPNAKNGAKQLISALDGADHLSILPFSSHWNWAAKDMSILRERDAAANMIDSLFPSGETALYDSITQAYQYLQDNRSSDKISAIVVLTDGEDNKSSTDLAALLANIRFDNESKTIRVFTIGYGAGARTDVLKSIADATQAKFYEGTPDNIRSVFKEISTFF